MKKRLISILILSLAWNAPASSEDITLNFREAHLMAVLEFYSKLTGKVFVPSDDVNGQVTVISPGPVSKAQAIQLLFSILDMRGFAVVETDNYYKVLPKAKALSSAATRRRSRVPGDRLITEIIKPEFVKAGEIFPSLQALVSPEGKLVADANLNALIVTDTVANVNQLKNLISNLDKPVSQLISHSYQLQYAKVEELAPLVTSLLQGAAGNTSSVGGSSGPITTVLQDVRSNTLIVSAPEKLQQQVALVLKDLDLRSPQVLLEATIVEVALNDAFRLGVQWQFFLKRMDPSASLSLSDQASNNLLSQLADGLTALPTAEGMTFALLKDRDYAVLLDQLASDSNARILSSPHLMASNNKESSLRIGDEIPILKEFRLDINGAPIETFDRLKVGLEVKITPSIAKNRDVSLELFINLSSVGAAIGTQSNNFTTAEREVKTNVVVKDRQALVISGLMRDNSNESESGIPFLRKIPGIGKLLGSENIQGEQRELLVIIRPQVITSEDEARLASDAQLRKHPNAVDAGAINPDVSDFDL